MDTSGALILDQVIFNVRKDQTWEVRQLLRERAEPRDPTLSLRIYAIIDFVTLVSIIYRYISRVDCAETFFARPLCTAAICGT